jgi:hypothetical protein
MVQAASGGNNRPRWARLRDANRQSAAERVRSIARTAQVLQECIRHLEDREREGLVTDGAERIAKLQKRLEECLRELARLGVSTDEVLSDGAKRVRRHQSAKPQPPPGILGWLRDVPPDSPIWAALQFVADRMALDAPGALEDPALEDVPAELAETSATLAGFLLSVAFLRRASRTVIERVEAATAAWDKTETGTGWFAGLCTIFRAHSRSEFPGKTDRHRVWFVLNALQVHMRLRGGPLPRVLREPDEAQLRRAEAVLRDTSPAAPRRGRRLSDESRARKFANAFKLYPPNRRDVNRPR